jgi:hypothetical protein
MLRHGTSLQFLMPNDPQQRPRAAGVKRKQNGLAGSADCGGYGGKVARSPKEVRDACHRSSRNRYDTTPLSLLLGQPLDRVRASTNIEQHEHTREYEEAAKKIASGSIRYSA